PDRSASGAQAGYPGNRQHVHWPVQGYHPGSHHRLVRSARTGAVILHGSDLGIADAKSYRISVCGPDLLDVLFWNVPLFDVHGTAAGYQPQALEQFQQKYAALLRLAGKQRDRALKAISAFAKNALEPF